MSTWVLEGLVHVIPHLADRPALQTHVDNSPKYHRDNMLKIKLHLKVTDNKHIHVLL